MKTIRFSAAEWAWLKDQAKRRGMSIAEVVRRQALRGFAAG